MKNNIQANDLINVGIFTVLYFVLGCCVAIPIGFVPIFLPVLGSLWTLITGIPFMLFAVRAKKFGMVTIMAVLSGLLMGLTGMGYWGILTGIIFGVLGDLIMKSGSYASAKKTILGYGVFSLWMVGTYIPMYFMVEQSRADFAKSFGEEYADRVMSVMPMMQVAGLLKRLYAEGKTVYIITHDPELICECCTHIIHLEAGAVKEWYPLEPGKIRDFFTSK